MNEEALNELAASITQLGVMHDLLVTPANAARLADGSLCEWTTDCNPDYAPRCFEIIDGHRRYLASALAGLTELPCKVFENVEEARLQMMVDSNMMREDVSPAEEGLLFLQLADKRQWGIEQLMSTFKRSEKYINDRVILVQGDPRICTALVNKQIVFGVAMELLKCKDEQHRKYLLDLAITHGANIRTVSAWIQDWRRQEAAGQVVQVPAPAALPYEQFTPEPERCLWCTRADYPEHFERVALHRWHLEELLRLLQQVGIHAASPSNGEAASASAPPATT